MMPQCQTARRERARQLFSAGEHAKSEAELGQLLEDDASDLRTLRVLLAVLREHAAQRLRRRGYDLTA